MAILVFKTTKTIRFRKPNNTPCKYGPEGMKHVVVDNKKLKFTQETKFHRGKVCL